MYKVLSKDIDLRYWNLILLAFFPVLPYVFISIITIFLLVTFLFYFCVSSQKNRHINVKGLLILSGFYLILCFSIFYSSNIEVGIKTLGRMLPLLVFPLIVFILSGNYSLNIEKGRAILKVFVFSTFLLLVYVLYLAFFTIDDFHSHSVRDKLLATSFLDLHSTYISMYFSAAIFILFSFYRMTKNYWSIILIILFIVGLLLIFSRGVVFSILIMSIVVFFIFNKKKLWQKILVLLVVACISTIVVYQVPFLKYRISEIFQYGFQSTENNRRLSSTAMRLAVYSCSFELITSHPLLGLGVGDLQDELHLCYQGLNSPDFTKKNLNTHNFYLFILGTTGIIGLISFLYSFGMLFKKAWGSKNPLFLNIFVLIALILFTENFLSRAYGLTYFCFFIILFYLLARNNKVNA
ncbi:O-antigen ligase family protein [Maribacter forsetii]|uniref:O-antigen ligase family protein n=1 Tax=Maribacter forsetii TaxID=444515 RepID=UPI000561088F|nr:O-antigen ligase family protein [Maribacter forsetii]